MVTFLQSFAKYVASSAAVSLLLRLRLLDFIKNPSHTAQAETPPPRNRCSDGSPKYLALAPVE